MLSGGQRQRIGLARAYLSDPRILILDDSTSAVDVETESHMQRALHRVRQGRTTLLITHRLAHARWVDRVVVLDQGKLVAEGSHDELIASSAIYRRMFAHHDVNLPALELPAAPQNMLAVAVQASGAGPAAGVGV